MKQYLSSQARLVLPLFILFFASLLFVSCSRNELEPPQAGKTGKNLGREYEGEQSYHSQLVFPFDRALWVPCANGGLGEYVWFTGTMRFNEQLTVNDNRFTYSFQATSSNVKGTGLVTGDPYVASGIGQESFSGVFDDNGQFTGTFIDRMQVTGRGPGNNATIFLKAHITVTRSGLIRTDIVDLSLTCR